MNNDLKIEIEIPEGISFSQEKNMLKAVGDKGTVEKKLVHPKIKIDLEDKKIIITAKKATKREKTSVGTFRAHIKNMIKGVSEGHSYRLKICFSHFPMNVTLNNKELIIKNFLGESHPRKLKIKEGAEVKIADSEITVESPDIEIAGQVAADIEKSTRITNRDRRIFQDGIFIIEKRGRKV